MTDAAPPSEVPDASGTRPVIPRASIILIALGGASVAAFGLAAASSIAGPVLFALVLTITVQPVRGALEKRGLPRGVATVSVIVAVFALLAGFFAALFIALGQFAALLPQYAPELESLASAVTEVLERIGFGPEQIGAIAAGFQPGAILDIIGGFLGGVGGLVFWFVTVFTLLLLMALDGTYLPALLRQLRPTRPHLVDAIGVFSHGVRRYMAVTTGLGIVQGLFNWAALSILGVPGAALWGMLSFLCSFIPNIGYFIAIIPPIVFGALVGGWPTVLWVIVIYGGINAVVQSVVQPRVVGNAVRLNQTITFASVLFWALVLGPIGAILAIPMTLLLRMLLIDSDPKAKWWRPLTGDIDETRARLRDEDEQRKAERKAAHEAAEWHED